MRSTLQKTYPESTSSTESTPFNEQVSNWEQALECIESMRTQSSNKNEYFEGSEHALLLRNNKGPIAYTNVELLTAFLEPYGEILSREKTGISLKQQRQISKAIRQARSKGFLAFTYL